MLFTLASGKCTMLDTIDGHSKLIVNRIISFFLIHIFSCCCKLQNHARCDKNKEINICTCIKHIQINNHAITHHNTQKQK